MIIFLIQNPLFSGGIANFSFGPEHLSFLHSLHLLLKRKSENKIRNGKLLKHKLSISEGGISLRKVCSRNFQFDTRWKYLSGLLGCRKRVVYTIGRRNDKERLVK